MEEPHARQGIPKKCGAGEACRGRGPHEELEALGPLPLREGVGNRARGLFLRRGELAVFHARTRALEGLPLGRGRPPWDHRPGMPPLLRGRALEREGPGPKGAALRPHQHGGEPRGGREGVPLLHGRDADPLLAERPLQVPPCRVPLRAAEGGVGRKDPGRSRVRAVGHGCLRRGKVFRRHCRIREGGHGRPLHPHHGGEPRAREGRAPPTADPLVPKYLVMGAAGTRVAGQSPRWQPSRTRG